MSIFSNAISFHFLFLVIFTTTTYGTIFKIQNNCAETVWAAAIPGGGRQLEPRQSWIINLKPNKPQTGQIWARTNCSFSKSGHGTCDSGDCNGGLQCQSAQSNGTSPYTLVEYSLNQNNNIEDFVNLSFANGFNIEIDISPVGIFESGQSESRVISYYMIVFCPKELREGNNATTARHFIIQNQCPYTVWAAAIPGGGQQLNSGQSWTLNVGPGTTGGRIWGRTNCSFDASGRRGCETGDCGGILRCQRYGTPPNTLAEFALNQFNNMDFYDISLVDGFNIPMDFIPLTSTCKNLECSADINGKCPNELRALGGCNNPCTVFKTNDYCCTNGQGSCAPTNFSRFFKERCPDAYSYPQDDATSTLTCTTGGNYRVVFCP
ncbi:hypothetical protein AQUCO_02500276v1 [Aquilegia coerulea]|uniref:Thaumatin-like protein n=1 Tax=Aquilegia coerulea TaxID=218851 RepID=A0A2G5DB49_AQUCA|nr:hypothetical protein AQUCO_02500276v1 [Aquilegia coerulea]